MFFFLLLLLCKPTKVFRIVLHDKQAGPGNKNFIARQGYTVRASHPSGMASCTQCLSWERWMAYDPRLKITRKRKKGATAPLFRYIWWCVGEIEIALLPSETNYYFCRRNRIERCGNCLAKKI